MQASATNQGAVIVTRSEAEVSDYVNYCLEKRSTSNLDFCHRLITKIGEMNAK